MLPASVDGRPLEAKLSPGSSWAKFKVPTGNDSVLLPSTVSTLRSALTVIATLEGMACSRCSLINLLASNHLKSLLCLKESDLCHDGRPPTVRLLPDLVGSDDLGLQDGVFGSNHLVLNALGHLQDERRPLLVFHDQSHHLFLDHLLPPLPLLTPSLLLRLLLVAPKNSALLPMPPRSPPYGSKSMTISLSLFLLP